MKIAIMAATLFAATASSAMAQPRIPTTENYCFITEEGGKNCGFVTKKQCDDAARGVTNDICFRNPYSVTPNGRRIGF